MFVFRIQYKIIFRTRSVDKNKLYILYDTSNRGALTKYKLRQHILTNNEIL